MAWSKEEVLLLVELVRRRPCLYDKDVESFYDSKLKLQVGQEIASIISSTRPETTVEDVLNKWEEMCAQFTSHCKKSKGKKKSNPKHYFGKMEFLCNDVEFPKILSMAEKYSNKENKAFTKHEMTEDNGRSAQKENRYPCLKLSQINVRNEDDVIEAEYTNGAQTRESIIAISIHSDNSSPINKRNPFSSSSESGFVNQARKRKFSTSLTNTPLHEVSTLALASPLVNVSDSILDRTEPFPNDCHSYDNENTSFASRKSSTPIEDEDVLYVKYIACKLKKLEGSQKLNFKLQLEKLFYESMNA